MRELKKTAETVEHYRQEARSRPLTRHSSQYPSVTPPVRLSGPHVFVQARSAHAHADRMEEECRRHQQAVDSSTKRLAQNDGAPCRPRSAKPRGRPGFHALLGDSR